MSNYIRHIQLPEIGKLGQEKISKTRVLIIGCGGLGAVASWYLSAAGVKKIILLDGDVVSESNIPRQILYSVRDLDKSKVEIAKGNLFYQYPQVEISAINEFFDMEKHSYLAQEVDIVLDCTDNIKTKKEIDNFCIENNLPIVTAGISTWDLHIIAGNLKNIEGSYSNTYFNIFDNISTESIGQDDCNINGVLATTAGLGGVFQSHITLLAITNPSWVINKLYIFDTKNLNLNTIEFDYTNENSKDKKNQIQTTNDSLKSLIFIGENLPLELQDKNCIMVPYYELEEFLLKNELYQNSIIACETGKKSKILVTKLNNEYHYNLESYIP
jgi:molybdopterin/thiamine biosynthesis adenylyltransferase